MTPDETAPPVKTVSEIVKAEGNPGEIHDLFVQRQNAYYTYDDGIRGRELWVTDKNGRSSMVADINPGPGSSNPRNFYDRPIGGFMFAATNTTFGEEPWYCEPQLPQVRLLKDISLGSMHSAPRPVGAWRDRFFFYATDFTQGSALWISDADSNRTAVLREIAPDAMLVDGANYAVFPYDEGMFFVAPNEHESILLHYTFADRTFQSLGTIRSGIRDIMRIRDTVVFGMFEEETGYELWRTDFENGETSLLKDIYPGPQSGDPEDFFMWNEHVYFRASTAEFGTELWRTDGTLDGTLQVVDTHEGVGDGGGSNLMVADGRLYYRGSSYRYGTELYSISDVPGDMAQVIDVWPGPESSHPYSIERIGKFLFFSANHEGFGEELWAIDLEDPEHPPFLVSDIRPGPESSEPHGLTPLNSNSGILITKADSADRLAKVFVEGDEITLEPYDPLPLRAPNAP